MNWVVPTDMWKDKTVWIIGGGPSVSRQFNVPDEIIRQIEKGKLPISSLSPYMEAIHDQPVIGINMAFRLGPWIDLCFWGDPSFYRKKGVKEGLAQFPGLKVGCHQWFNDKKMEKAGIYGIAREKERAGISDDPAKVRWNWNSGAAAISVAANAGAKRIILVGFDMHSVPSHSHWHNEYGHPKRPPFKTHLGGFKQISIDAKRRGIEIINACPDSAIPHFPKCNVSDIIKMKNKVIVDTNVERSIGTLNKYRTLSHFHNILKPDLYLEIGIGRGNSLKQSKAAKSIAIDPRPRLKEKFKNVEIVKDTSDKFFKFRKLDQKVDLAFIDGQHLIENVLKDFINVEKNCNDGAVILLDDVAPAHPIQSNRIKQSVKWAGDVWKIVPILRQYRPDLDLKLLDVAPTGMLMVSKLDPENTVLEKAYKDIVNDWQNAVMPLDVMKRDGVYANLDFLKYDFQFKVKVGVITPTCSPERKPFVDFLHKQMKRQTVQPNWWYIIDYPNETGQMDLTKRYKQAMNMAFNDGMDLVLFMEDDDYYPTTYIEDMVDNWIQAGMPHIIGVKHTVYYHLKNKRFRIFNRDDHCSAFCTGVAKGVKYDIAPDNSKMYDVKLWRANANSRAQIELPIGRKPVGIKHGIGMTGGGFHNEARYPESSHQTLADYVDKQALEFYNSLEL